MSLASRARFHETTMYKAPRLLLPFVLALLLPLSAAARPICDTQNVRAGDPCNPIPEPDEPKPPAPLVPSAPDAAFQISPCLPAGFDTKVIDAVEKILPAGADVRTSCVANTQHIGAWLRPPRVGDNAAARAL